MIDLEPNAVTCKTESQCRRRSLFGGVYLIIQQVDNVLGHVVITLIESIDKDEQKFILNACQCALQELSQPTQLVFIVAIPEADSISSITAIFGRSTRIWYMRERYKPSVLCSRGFAARALK